MSTVMTTARLDEICLVEYPRLFGMLRLYCGDARVAEELAQETLVRLVQHWDRVQAMDEPAGWIHTVALNLARSSFRRRAAERRANARLPHPRSVAAEHDSDVVVAVRTAVAALPARQREVVILRYYLDLGVRETATRMGVAEGTVKRTLSDAINALRAAGLEVADA